MIGQHKDAAPTGATLGALLLPGEVPNMILALVESGQHLKAGAFDSRRLWRHPDLVDLPKRQSHCLWRYIAPGKYARFGLSGHKILRSFKNIDGYPL
jgi:hypothetical protein